jgi:hypothetical protein
VTIAIDGRRPRVVRGLVAVFAGVLAVVVGAAGCTKATTQCDCADPAITLTIPADIAASVNGAPHVSGTACDGVVPTCVNQTGGCSEYRFLAKASGVCHVEVDFASGQAFTADVTTVAGSDCCEGFYATPASAGQIEVPSPDGGN